jgi:hypothetical protein
MIRNEDELIDLVGKFVTGYDEAKTISKKLFNNLKKNYKQEPQL